MKYQVAYNGCSYEAGEREDVGDCVYVFVWRELRENLEEWLLLRSGFRIAGTRNIISGYQRGSL